MSKGNNVQKKRTGRLKKRLLIVLLLLMALMSSYPINAATDDVGEPTVIVSNYKELEKAIANASEGDVIGINAAIEMEDDIDCGDRVAIKRMSGDACLVFHDFPYISIRNIVFDGNGQTYVSSVPMVILNNMARTIIMDCYFQNCYTAVSGGALQLNNSCAEMRNCDFQYNHALQGGHICMIGRSEMQMYDCALKGGYANTIGGAIATCDWFCTTSIYSSTLTNNTSGVCGGGIYNSGDFGIWDSTVYNNHSRCGADIANTENARLQIPNQDSLKFYYNQVGIYPKGWVNDYDGSSGLKAYNIDSTQENSLMKLLYTTTPPEPETEPKPEETETEQTEAESKEKETGTEKQPESKSESETKKESETETESEKQSEIETETKTETETEAKLTESETKRTESEIGTEKDKNIPEESESERLSEPHETIPDQSENQSKMDDSLKQESTEPNVKEPSTQESSKVNLSEQKKTETEENHSPSINSFGGENTSSSGSDDYIKITTGEYEINGTIYYYKNGRKYTGNRKIGRYTYYYKKGIKYTGWRTIKKKKYYYTDGKLVKGWKTIKKKRYYFKKGLMQTGQIKIKGKYYYFNKKGVMQKNKWIKIKGYKYYFNKKGIRTKKKRA